ncbi:hypothetical protein QTO34_009537 [Cnephaeus nilssonii]|uniref:Phosphofurin acidic cluster sorting protein 2 n=1 Tax=Cnephaeus nilssonii TaxID=3371016 RepID=A0AA40HIW8_CNENI|nr:hypothetical protein QTO34_009537 [Eptesicus nilssonii]
MSPKPPRNSAPDSVAYSTPREQLAQPWDCQEAETSAQDMFTEKLPPSGRITKTWSLLISSTRSQHLGSVHYRYKSFLGSVQYRYKSFFQTCPGLCALPLQELLPGPAQKSPNEESSNFIPFMRVVELGIVKPSSAVSGDSGDVVRLGSSVLSFNPPYRSVANPTYHPKPRCQQAASSDEAVATRTMSMTVVPKENNKVTCFPKKTKEKDVESKSHYRGSGSRRPCSESCSRLCRRFNPHARHLCPFSRRSPQISTQENREELTDGVLNSMPLQEARIPDISTNMQHGHRGEKPSSTCLLQAAAASSSPAGLARSPTVLNTPVPMNLFSTWEVDCSSPSCVLRLCSLTLKKLVILKELEKELISMVIAVQMQGSKDILRSHEIMLPTSGQVETDLALTFSLQYPHFLKGEGNKLQIMLQQRKCNNNQIILGYTTLATGAIHMAEVMQRPPEGGQVLSLSSSIQESSIKVAEIWISSLSSQPINYKDTTMQTSPKAKSTNSYTEGKSESFSELEASYNVTPRQDLEEDDFDLRQLKKQQQCMQRKLEAESHGAASQVQHVRRGPRLRSGPYRACSQVEEDLDLLYDNLENPSDSGPDMEDDGIILSNTKTKTRQYFEGLAHSSWQMEMRSIHSARRQKEPPRLADMPVKAQGPGGKLFSGSVSDLMAYSTPATKVDKTCIFSLSSQPVNHLDSAILASTKADNFSEGDSEIVFSELEVSYNAAHRHDLDEDDLDLEKPIGRRRSMTRQQNYQQKVAAWLQRFQMTEEVLDSEQDPEEQVPDVDKDVALLFYRLVNPSNSSSDMEDDDRLLTPPMPELMTYSESLSSGPDMEEDDRVLRTPKPKPKPRSYFESLSSDSGSDWVAHSMPNPGEQPAQPEDSPEAETSAHVMLTKKLPPSRRTTKTEALVLPSSSSKGKQPACRGWSRSLNESSNSLIKERCPVPQSHLQIPRTTVYDQLNHILISSDCLPKNIILISTSDRQGQFLSDVLQQHMLPVVCTCSMVDVQEAFSSIISWIQRYCNCNTEAPMPVKIAVAGAQHYFSTVLRVFVEQLSHKNPDWLGYMRFLVIPLGSHPVASYLGSVDYRYNHLFQDLAWQDMFNNVEAQSSVQNIVSRITEYITGANCVHQLPIAEAMLISKPKSPGKLSSQKFIPFVGAVKVGIVEPISATSGDTDDAVPSCSNMLLSTAREASHNPTFSSSVSGGLPFSTQGVSAELMELQVSRLPSSGEDAGKPTMSMTVVTKEKKKKVMFLPKKDKAKDLVSKSQCIQGIGRLVCSAKNQENRQRVLIDGVEWNDVTFFQLAAQWSSHVKHFPICIFGHSNSTF